MKDKVSTVMGRFGRLSAGAFSRPVNSHSFREPSVLFHLGGAELLMTVGDRTFPFKSGEMLLIDAWTPHARTVRAGESSQLVSLLIEPTLLDPNATGSPDDAFRFKQTLATIEPDMREQLDALTSLMFDQPMARLETIQARIEHIIDMLRSRYAGSRRHNDRRRSAIDVRVRRAFESLRSSAIQGVKIESLAAGSGMSRSHFFRQFKRSIGVSPQHVIDEERIVYALKALSTSGVMLSKLSEELGFSAPAHFTRFFVQHLGCTPSQFRRSLLVL